MIDSEWLLRHNDAVKVALHQLRCNIAVTHRQGCSLGYSFTSWLVYIKHYKNDFKMKISSSSLAEKALTATSHDVPWAQYDTASCVLPSVFSTPVSAVTTQYTFINSSAELLTDTDRVVFWHYTQRRLDAFDQWCIQNILRIPCQ